MRRALHILLVVLAVSCRCLAEPVVREASKAHDDVTGKVRVHVDADAIHVADSLQLTVEVDVPAGYTAELPAFSDYGFALDFSDRSSRFRPTDVGEPVTELQAGGGIVLRQTFTLEPWLSGDYSIPPLMISFFKKASADVESDRAADAELGPIPEFSVITTAIRVKVSPLGEGRQSLVDIYGQSDYGQEALKKRVRRQEDKSEQELRREEAERQQAVMALNERGFPWWLLWGIIVVAGTAASVWVLGRRRIAALLSPKQLPAHELAHRALAELLSKQLPANGKVKEFYYELSYILREYIGNRFQLYAVHQSTEEFVLSLVDNNPFDDASEQVLREFSELADTVKYSRHRPGANVAEQSFTVAQNFVDTTKQVEEDVA